MASLKAKVKDDCDYNMVTVAGIAFGGDWSYHTVSTSFATKISKSPFLDVEEVTDEVVVEEVAKQRKATAPKKSKTKTKAKVDAPKPVKSAT